MRRLVGCGERAVGWAKRWAVGCGEQLNAANAQYPKKYRNPAAYRQFFYLVIFVLRFVNFFFGDGKSGCGAAGRVSGTVAEEVVFYPNVPSNRINIRGLGGT